MQAVVLVGPGGMASLRARIIGAAPVQLDKCFFFCRIIPGLSAAEIYGRLMARAEQGGAAIGEGMAVPHARLAELDDFIDEQKSHVQIIFSTI